MNTKRSDGTLVTGARGQRGIALVMVLWLVVLLTIVAASFATHSRTETRMAGNLVERQKARLLIESGFSRAQLELLATTGEERWQFNGEVHEVQGASGTLRIAIRNASGLVDLNRASSDDLLQLFSLIDERPEVRQQLVDALADWRDGDDLRRLNGAEDDDYAHAGLAYGTVDRDLESVDELGYVMGFDRDAVEKLRPYVTVHSGVSRIDSHYADADLVELLNGGAAAFGGQLADAFDQLDSELADISGEAGAESPGLSRSAAYRISIEATTEGGGRAAVDIDVTPSTQRDTPFTILAWHERF